MPGIDRRRQTADPTMGSDSIEIASPVGERLADVRITLTADHQFFRKVLPVCNAPPASNCYAFSDVA